MRGCLYQKLWMMIKLYIDSDIIVDGSLQELFDMKFKDDQLLAASKEIVHAFEGSTFNSGVIGC